MVKKIALPLLIAASWLCPFWIDPTPAVFPLLWAGTCLGILLLGNSFQKIAPPTPSLQALFLALLASLAVMVAWRSTSLPNTLAAVLCLSAIALSATLAKQWQAQTLTHLVAWGLLLAALGNSAQALTQYFGLATDGAGKAMGFLRQRNQMASLANFALISLLYLWHQQKVRTHWAALCLLILTCTLAATASRTGALSLVVLCLSVGLVALHCEYSLRRKLLQILLFAFFSYLIFALILPSFQKMEGADLLVRVVESKAPNGQINDSRLLLWSNTWTLITQSPLLGVGWRELAQSLALADFGSSLRFSEQADNAHNLLLQFAVELGLPFTVLWSAALAWLVLRNKPWVKAAPHKLLAWGILLVIGIHSLLEFPLWYAPFQMATGFAAGLIFTKHDKPTSQYPCGLQAIVGTGFVIFCAYAAFDYFRVVQVFTPSEERLAVFRENTFAKAEGTWLFQRQMQFARLMSTPVTPNNAAEIAALAKEVLHFSPEPSVLDALKKANGLLTSPNR
jgi:O-antigen ligase